MTTLADPRIQSEPTRRRINVDEYYAMAEAGILAPHERVELIDGEIITMSPIGNEHAASVDTITDFLVPLVTGRAIVRVQSHLRLDEQNQSEPDLMLLKRREDYYRYRAPGPTDVLLLVEVSDSSLAFDRSVKLALYARFNVPEVWIENIPDRVVEAYTNPVEGQYTESRIYRPGETITPGAFPDVSLSVSELI